MTSPWAFIPQIHATDITQYLALGFSNMCVIARIALPRSPIVASGNTICTDILSVYQCVTQSLFKAWMCVWIALGPFPLCPLSLLTVTVVIQSHGPRLTLEVTARRLSKATAAILSVLLSLNTIRQSAYLCRIKLLQCLAACGLDFCFNTRSVVIWAQATHFNLENRFYYNQIFFINGERNCFCLLLFISNTYYYFPESFAVDFSSMYLASSFHFTDLMVVVTSCC
jgi:hypothetical protein